MMQGDSYPVPVVIKKKDGTIVTDTAVQDVEIVLGNMRKSFADGTVTYVNGQWLFHLTQEETFGITAPVKAQIRIKWNNGDVEGCNLGSVTAEYSRSKEVL